MVGLQSALRNHVSTGKHHLWHSGPYRCNASSAGSNVLDCSSVGGKNKCRKRCLEVQMNLLAVVMAKLGSLGMLAAVASVIDD